MSEAKAPATIQDWFEKGVRCFHKPDGVAAVQALEKVVDMDPGYRHPDGDNAYFYLGKIHEVEGNLERAIVLYSRALAVQANDEESLIGRGSCYTALKRHPEAVADFSRVLAFPDKHRRVARKNLLYVIAENYRQMEDWGQAIRWGQKALAADPGNYRHQELLKAVQSQVAANQKVDAANEKVGVVNEAVGPSTPEAEVGRQEDDTAVDAE